MWASKRKMMELEELKVDSASLERKVNDLNNYIININQRLDIMQTENNTYKDYRGNTFHVIKTSLLYTDEECVPSWFANGLAQGKISKSRYDFYSDSEQSMIYFIETNISRQPIGENGYLIEVILDSEKSGTFLLAGELKGLTLQ